MVRGGFGRYSFHFIEYIESLPLKTSLTLVWEGNDLLQNLLLFKLELWALFFFFRVKLITNKSIRCFLCYFTSLLNQSAPRNRFLLVRCRTSGDWSPLFQWVNFSLFLKSKMLINLTWAVRPRTQKGGPSFARRDASTWSPALSTPNRGSHTRCPKKRQITFTNTLFNRELLANEAKRLEFFELVETLAERTERKGAHRVPTIGNKDFCLRSRIYLRFNRSFLKGAFYWPNCLRYEASCSKPNKRRSF